VGHYSKEFKENILLTLENSGLSVRAFAKQHNINISTLYDWRKRYSLAGFRVSDKASDNWSSQEKFTVVLETATLNEVQLNEYCRKKGLYPEQVSKPIRKRLGSEKTLRALSKINVKLRSWKRI